MFDFEKPDQPVVPYLAKQLEQEEEEEKKIVAEEVKA